MPHYQLPITNYQFSLAPHLSLERLYQFKSDLCDREIVASLLNSPGRTKSGFFSK
ncbi:hypothetical protein [Microcoleus anatoxicus]|uniref:hypothetical protein n=1 Tax=Microcoleus anatoxicus TaxID=2705319 RepID=UPI0030C9C3B9